jgi:predicted metalloprotease with PDZ domain
MRSVVWIGFIVMGLIGPASEPASREGTASLTYEIRVDTLRRELFIEGRFEHPPRGDVVFDAPSAIGPHPLRFLADVRFFDDLGSLPSTPSDGGRRRVPQPHGALRFTYRVRTDAAARALPPKYAWRTVMPSAGPRAAYVTRYALIRPADFPPDAPVRLVWKTPASWTVATPWSLGTRETVVPSLRALLKNYYVAFRGGSVVERRVENVAVRFVWTGEGRLDEAPGAVAAMTRVVRQTLALGGGRLGPRLTVLLHASGDGDASTGATAGTASVQLQLPAGRPFAELWRASGDQMLRTLAHELIHTWTYAAGDPAAPFEAWGPGMCWLREGFTEYLAHLTLFDAGLLDRDAFTRDLRRAAALSRRRNADGRWSLLSACAHFYDDPSAFYFTYHEGMILAFSLDVELRRLTHGAKTLPAFMRRFVTTHPGVEKTRATFLEAWRAYAPAALAGVDARLARSGSLDPAPFLRRFDLLPAALAVRAHP